MRSGRWRGRLLIGVALLALLAGAALLILDRLPPSSELASAALTRVLGRRVELERLQIRVRGQLEFDIGGLRIYPPEAASGTPPTLEVPSALARQSWPRLLAGQITPLSWRLERPVLRLDDARGGGMQVPAVPELDLIVVDGRVEWRRSRGPVLSVRGLGIEARRGRLTSRTRGQAYGELFADEVFLAAIDVDFEGWLDDGALRGDIDELDLSWLPQDPVGVRGRARGRFELRRDNRRTRLSTDVAVAGLRLELPQLRRPVQPRTASVQALLEWREHQLHLELRRMRLDDVDVAGRVSLGPERVRADLRLAAFEPGPRERLHPLALLGYRMETWERVNQRILSGRIRDARVRVDASRAELAALLAFDRRPAPDELEISLAVEGGTYRPGADDPPLEDISGLVAIRGNVLQISKLQLRRGARRLSELELRIDGMHRLAHLPRDERSTGPGPDTPLPGLQPLLDALRGSPATERRPLRARFEHLEVRHPLTVLPVRGAAGALTQEADTWRVEGATAIVGGVPAGFDLAWSPAAGKLSIALRYGDGTAPPRAPSSGWLTGRLALDQLRLGQWVVDEPAGLLVARAARVRLTELRGRLGGGTLTGSGEIDLGQPGSAPYAFDLSLAEADATALAPRLGLEPANLRGSLESSLRLSGRLAPGERFLDAGRVEATLAIRDGHLGGLPVLMAIARFTSPSGSLGVLMGRPLQFSRVDTRLLIADGVLAISDFQLLGPELRALGYGEMDLVGPERRTDAIVTLLFLRTLDRVLENLPVVRMEGFAALSFRVRGPRDNLEVSPLPPEVVRSLGQAAGWATDRLMDGIKRLWGLLPGRGGDDGDADEPRAAGAEPDPKAR
jgi:hypothetical protein